VGVLRERLWKIRARSIISAAGAFERPMVFPDNDRPGIMLAGAAEKYALAYGVACGHRVVIAANSDRAYAVATALRRCEMEVTAIVDRRAEAQVTADRSALSGVKILYESTIESVTGGRRIRGCSAAPINGRSGSESFDCDLILSAGGARARRPFAFSGGREITLVGQGGDVCSGWPCAGRGKRRRMRRGIRERNRRQSCR